MRYDWHEYLVGPARERPELWRSIAGLVLAGVFYAVMLFGFFGLMALVLPNLGEATFLGREPFDLILILSSFAFMTLGTVLAAFLLQGRMPLSLIGPIPLALNDFWIVLRLGAVLIGLSLLLPTPIEGELSANLDLGLWAMLLPLSLLVLLIQVSAEEILFRGYFQSQLAARFKSPLVWMIVPSVIFGALHYDPAAAGENAWLIALWAVFYGIMLADITARSGTLGPAIALHLLNNASAILIVSAQGDLSGLSLYSFPFSLADTEVVRAMLPLEAVMMLIMWLGARLALRR
ncbi:CPBP family intramembrane glutamic endopeptidase [Algirhabdus cladophorae]|uniref:CPBP family intramembrane glutamic endopeptidase n=1 Tax=Algirhabdus cladophorae TaxID=3377108 RepID=UPI003B84AAE2